MVVLTKNDVAKHWVDEVAENKFFCPKCHRLAAMVKRDEGGVRLIQDGKVKLNFGTNSRGNTISVGCPSGHPVKVEM